METEQKVIALGFFDGVHLGHAALLRTAAERAALLGVLPAAVTFDAHPDTLVRHETVPLITPLPERAALMEELCGIRQVITVHFDRAMMEMPWDAFVENFLVRKNGAVHLVAGHDFRFGYRGEGTPERLKAKCASLGLGCDIIPPVKLDGVTVSSSRIRSLLAAGAVEEADRLLGHPYSLSGAVAHGKGLGGVLGFPTANLSFPAGALVPAYGVYAARARLAEGTSRAAVVNVGVRPTVEEVGAVNAEAFLLDFHGDLYGAPLRLEFFKFLRPERKFPSQEALRAEVLRNAEQARAYFQDQA